MYIIDDGSFLNVFNIILLDCILSRAGISNVHHSNNITPRPTGYFHNDVSKDVYIEKSSMGIHCWNVSGYSPHIHEFFNFFPLTPNTPTIDVYYI